MIYYIEGFLCEHPFFSCGRIFRLLEIEILLQYDCYGNINGEDELLLSNIFQAAVVNSTASAMPALEYQ